MRREKKNQLEKKKQIKSNVTRRKKLELEFGNCSQGPQS